MAVHRVPPKCPICGEDYKGINNNDHANFIGDTFIMWDVARHVCKSNEGSALTRYEESLEKLVDTIRNVTTVEAIILLKKYVQKLPTEE